MNNPTPQQIRKTRKDAGLTQKQAAELVHVSMRQWRRWEAGDKINMTAWKLFLYEIGDK